ncbi:hypothetical protein HYV81_05830 [Candidatus Woesearchaeota archaeon]|nr:hypothetical protein [Candidatus Woesearchaeota archaeon]
MSLIETLAGFHGLVLVHPDMVIPHKSYVQNLALATDAMRSTGIVFVFPHRDNKHGYIPSELYERWLKIPGSHESLYQGNHQLEAYFMAWKLGKHPSEIRLAAGGLESGVCVKNWMAVWCRELKVNFDTPEPLIKVPVPDPIGYGEIINALTERG